MADIAWKIVHGVPSSMVDGFMKSVFFSERELDMEGIVQMLIDGRQDAHGIALREFVDSRGDDYLHYVDEVAGAYSNKKDSPTMMNAYVDGMGLRNEFEAFMAGNAWRWNGEYCKESVRRQLVEERLVPLFDQMSRNSMYIYREGDHWGVHLERTAE